MVSIEKQPLRRKLGLLEGQRGLGKEQRRKDQIAVVFRHLHTVGNTQLFVVSISVWFGGDI